MFSRYLINVRFWPTVAGRAAAVNGPEAAAVRSAVQTLYLSRKAQRRGRFEVIGGLSVGRFSEVHGHLLGLPGTSNERLRVLKINPC